MRRTTTGTIAAAALAMVIAILPSAGHAYAMERCHLTGVLHGYPDPLPRNYDFAVQGSCMTPSGAHLTLSASGNAPSWKTNMPWLFAPSYLVDVYSSDLTAGTQSSAQEYWRLGPITDYIGTETHGVYSLGTSATYPCDDPGCPRIIGTNGGGVLVHGPKTVVGTDAYWYLTIEMTYGLPWNTDNF